MNHLGIVYTRIGNELCVGLNNDDDNNAVEEGYTHVTVVLPTHVSNYPVTKVGSRAFRYNPSLISILISKTIKSIEFDALALIVTLQEVIFEPGSTIKELKQGFVYNTNVKYVVVPPTVKFIGIYTAGLTYIEDFVYCSNAEANYDALFYSGDTPYYPKRVHVKRSYSYSKVGTFTGELMKDGLCESLFPSKITCNIRRHCEKRIHVSLLLMILFDSAK